MTRFYKSKNPEVELPMYLIGLKIEFLSIEGEGGDKVYFLYSNGMEVQVDPEMDEVNSILANGWEQVEYSEIQKLMCKKEEKEMNGNGNEGNRAKIIETCKRVIPKEGQFWTQEPSAEDVYMRLRSDTFDILGIKVSPDRFLSVNINSGVVVYSLFDAEEMAILEPINGEILFQKV